MNGVENNRLRNLNDCGCCAGITAQTPAVVKNRPGLSAIAYRIGTQSQFKQSLLAALSDPALPALQGLRTRENDDFSIALLDGWATVADVLAFYQERIANESYLRTATERQSLLQLARLIGYELRPGVAASTYLAFTLDDASGSPGEVTIDIGTKVQSVPGPNEKPQTFETVEKIQGCAEWNALAAQTIQVQNLAQGDTQVYLDGVTTNLKPGDMLLFVDADSATPFSSQRWDFQQITAVIPDKKSGTTMVQLANGLGTKSNGRSLPTHINVYTFRQRAALFGANAPDWRTMPESVREQYAQDGIVPGLSGDYFIGTNFEDWQCTEIDSTVDFPQGPSPSAGFPTKKYSVRWTGLVKAPASGTFTFVTESDDGVRLWVNGQKLIDNWTDHGSTPDQGTIPLEAGKFYDLRLEYYQNGGGAVIQLEWSGPSLPQQTIPKDCFFHLEMPDDWPDFNIADAASVPTGISTIHLDAVYSQIVQGSGVLLSQPADQELYQVNSTGEDSMSDFTLTAKTTTLDLLGAAPVSQFGTFLRETVVFAQSELLPLAGKPTTIPITGDTITLAQPPSNKLTPGQLLAAYGQDSITGAPICEVVTVSSINGVDLVVMPPLANSYARARFSLNANVALATHGETVNEILGGGDASQPYQQFTLRQSPLTHVSAATPSGAESTLAVRVNGLLWHEMPTLYGRGPRDRVFVSRRSDDGTTTIEFGDGKTGARLPTGQENVGAVYRKGIGLGGLVEAGQLSQLLKRPLGVKSVINPLAATGAADPEILEDARTNAPLTVLTLDRIVSLLDYENFARAFLGIAKSLAAWTWDGQRRGVFVTVAGPEGAAVMPASDLGINLLAAMKDASDPYVPLSVKTYRSATFKIAVKIKINPDYDRDKVMAAIEQALRNKYSFAAREFGEPVEASEVVAVMQSVAGVVAVDLNSLYRTDGAAPINDRLLAEFPRLDSSGQMLGAELLTLDPAPLELEVMT